MQLRNLRRGAVFAPMAGPDRRCVPPSDGRPRRGLDRQRDGQRQGPELQRPKIPGSAQRGAPPRAVRYPAVRLVRPKLARHFAGAAREQGIRFDIFDINMGCPAPKITGSGAGSRLLLDPALRTDGRSPARRALGEDTPLTVKMRIGWDADHPDRRGGGETAVRPTART